MAVPLSVIAYHIGMFAVPSAGNSDQSACQRSHGRATMMVPVKLETPLGAVSGTMLDLSLGGARVETRHAIPRGEALWLVLGKVKVFATVQWARGGRIGVKFDEKLPKALVLSLRGEVVDPKALEDAEARLTAQKWQGGRPATRAKEVRIADVLGTWNPGSMAAGGKRRGAPEGAISQALRFILCAAGVGALIGVGSFLLL